MKNLFEPAAAAELKSRAAAASARQRAPVGQAAGPAGCSTHPHSFFGRLTPQEWAVLTYKHLDHHLRQFGA